MENAYIHPCMHMHGIAAYGGWGHAWFVGVRPQPTTWQKWNLLPKIQEGREKERRKGVCAPLVWERGVAWHYRLSIDIAVLAMHAACLQVSGQAGCCGSCTQHTCGACWWCARMHIHLSMHAYVLLYNPGCWFRT